MNSHDETCWTSTLLDNQKKDHGLMGPAHAASAGGVFMLLIGLAPVFTFQALGSINIALALLGIIVFIGGALVPDLDNSRSTVRSALGFSGSIMSSIFRATSLMMQKTVRTKKDTDSPDPHRGFWHTFVGAAVMGLTAWGLSEISYEVNLPILGVITLGEIFSIIIVVLLLHVALSGLAKDLIKKLDKLPVVGELISYIASFIIVILLFQLIPDDLSFRWIGVCLFGGAAVHILGDALTRAGVPLFFPIAGLFTGKCWWNTRFATFEASNEGLNKTISVLSTISAFVGLGFLIYFFISG